MNDEMKNIKEKLNSLEKDKEAYCNVGDEKTEVVTVHSIPPKKFIQVKRCTKGHKY